MDDVRIRKYTDLHSKTKRLECDSLVWPAQWIEKDKECVGVGLIFNPLYSDIYGRYDFASNI